MSRLVKAVVLLVLLIWLGAWGGDAYALTCTSTLAGGDWNAALTWTGCGGGTPGAGDNVIIATTGAGVVTVNVQATMTALTINSGSVLTISNGSNFRIRPTGATSISGTINLGTSTSSSRFTGLVTVVPGGTWNNTGNQAVNFRGGLTNNGTFTAGTGIYTFNTNNQSIGGTTATTIPRVTVNGVTLTNNGNLTVTTALAGTGGLTNSATGTLNIGGTSTITTLTANAAGNTVNYTGAAQTVKLPSGAPATYYNLTLSGNGNKIMPGTAMTVAGDFTMSGTATATTAQNLTINGNLDVGSGTTLTVGGFNITVAGTTSVTGTLTHNNLAGTKTYTGDVTIYSGGILSETVAEPITYGGNVTINNGGTLTENGAATMTFAGNLQNDGTLTASTGVHTFTGVAKTLSGANAIVIPSVTVSGTYQNTGTLTVATALAGAGTLTNGNGATGTLNIGATAANLTLTTLTATAANNTVNYNLGGAQTVKATAYHDLTLSTSGIKTMTNVTTIDGNLTISGTATMTGNAGFTVAGAFNYTSTGVTTLTAATAISIGTYNQTAGTLNGSNNTITVTGTGANTWSKAGGTFTPGAAGTVIFTGAAPQIGASNFNNLTIDVGSGNTATLSGTATPAGNLTVSTGTLDLATFTANRTAAGGTLTVANGATLRIGGTNTFPTNYNTHTLGATSTVEYNGANQSVAAEGAPGYGNLTLSGSGTKTAAGSFTVRGDLAITGVTFAGSTFTQTVNGNVNNTGTQTATTGSITLSNGSAAHVLSGTGAYANLVMNDAFGATLSASPLVSGVLTLTNGIITTNANVLEVTSSCATGIIRTGGYILGNLSLHYPTNAGTTTCTFPIGDATAYSPVTVAIVNVSSSLANSILTARTDPGDHPDTTALVSGIDPGKSVNRYWTLTKGASLAFATYNATFTFVNPGDIDGGANTANFIIGRKSGGVWTYPTMGAKNPTNTTATGITQANGFGEFAIGERAMPGITVAKSVTTYFDPVNNTTNPKAIPGAEMLYTITVTNSGPGSVDADTTVITDPIPANTIMCVSTLCSNPVMVFTCSAAPSCGLAGISIQYSDNGGFSYGYTPAADPNGYDPNVTNIQITASGALNGALSSPYPNFSVTFKVKIK